MARVLGSNLTIEKVCIILHVTFPVRSTNVNMICKCIFKSGNHVTLYRELCDELTSSPYPNCFRHFETVQFKFKMFLVFFTTYYPGKVFTNIDQ